MCPRFPPHRSLTDPGNGAPFPRSSSASQRGEDPLVRRPPADRAIGIADRDRADRRRGAGGSDQAGHLPGLADLPSQPARSGAAAVRTALRSPRRAGRALSHQGNRERHSHLRREGRCHAAARGLHVRVRLSLRPTDRLLREFDELYWNVTGNSWTFPIDKASATVLLPGERGCSTGPPTPGMPAAPKATLRSIPTPPGIRSSRQPSRSSPTRASRSRSAGRRGSSPSRRIERNC